MGMTLLRSWILTPVLLGHAVSGLMLWAEDGQKQLGPVQEGIVRAARCKGTTYLAQVARVTASVEKERLLRTLRSISKRTDDPLVFLAAQALLVRLEQPGISRALDGLVERYIKIRQKQEGFYRRVLGAGYEQLRAAALREMSEERRASWEKHGIMIAPGISAVRCPAFGFPQSQREKWGEAGEAMLLEFFVFALYPCLTGRDEDVMCGALCGPAEGSRWGSWYSKLMAHVFYDETRTRWARGQALNAMASYCDDALVEKTIVELMGASDDARRRCRGVGAADTFVGRKDVSPERKERLLRAVLKLLREDAYASVRYQCLDAFPLDYERIPRGLYDDIFAEVAKVAKEDPEADNRENASKVLICIQPPRKSGPGK